MTGTALDRRLQFQQAIARFLQERRDAKLEKLQVDDPKRDELTSQYIPEKWLAGAAARVDKIKVVTHLLKATHPSAKGTSVFRRPDQLTPRRDIGTHVLGPNFHFDYACEDAKHLDVVAFFRLTIEGQSVISLILAGDPDFESALSIRPDDGRSWMKAFATVAQPRIHFSTDTRAKQLFWLTGGNAADDAGFHLLAPLYASSLAHAVYLSIQETRFGELAKAARQAKREQLPHDDGYADYPNLAVQKLGGTKPQNISQLNSERRGDNYLLASLPPRWKSEAVKPPLGIESVFPRFARRDEVRRSLRALALFLASNPDPTMETRDRVDELIDAIAEELASFAAELHQALTPGWSADDRCVLPEEECLWLDPERGDPERADSDPDFHGRWLRMEWPEKIGKRFGNWLNSRLDEKLPVGSVEQRQWSRMLLLDEEWAGQLHEQRSRLNAPHYIPTRGAS